MWTVEEITFPGAEYLTCAPWSTQKGVVVVVCILIFFTVGRQGASFPIVTLNLQASLSPQRSVHVHSEPGLSGQSRQPAGNGHPGTSDFKWLCSLPSLANFLILEIRKAPMTSKANASAEAD